MSLSFGLVIAVAMGSATVYAKKSEVFFEQKIPKNGRSSEVATDLSKGVQMQISTTTAAGTKSISKIDGVPNTTQVSSPTQTTDAKNAQYQLLQNQLAAAQLLQEELDAQKAAQDAALRASRRSRAS